MHLEYAWCIFMQIKPIKRRGVKEVPVGLMSSALPGQMDWYPEPLHNLFFTKKKFITKRTSVICRSAKFFWGCCYRYAWTTVKFARNFKAQIGSQTNHLCVWNAICGLVLSCIGGAWNSNQLDHTSQHGQMQSIIDSSVVRAWGMSILTLWLSAN